MLGLYNLANYTPADFGWWVLTVGHSDLHFLSHKGLSWVSMLIQAPLLIERFMKMTKLTLTAVAAALVLTAGSAFAADVKAPAGFCEIGSTPSTEGLVLDVLWDDGKGYDALYNGVTAYVWGLRDGKVTSGSAIEIPGDTTYICW